MSPGLLIVGTPGSAVGTVREFLRDVAGDADSAADAAWLERVVAFNAEVLEFLGGRWDSPPSPPAGWHRLASMASFMERAEALVDGSPSPVLVADVQAAFLLPLWATVLGDGPTVFVVGDPQRTCECVGTTSSAGVQVWARYVERALSETDVSIVTTDRRLADGADGVADELSLLLEMELGPLQSAVGRQAQDRPTSLLSDSMRSAVRVYEAITLDDLVGAASALEDLQTTREPLSRLPSDPELLESRIRSSEQLRADLEDTLASAHERIEVLSSQLLIVQAESRSVAVELKNLHASSTAASEMTVRLQEEAASAARRSAKDLERLKLERDRLAEHRDRLEEARPGLEQIAARYRTLERGTAASDRVVDHLVRRELGARADVSLHAERASNAEAALANLRTENRRLQASRANSLAELKVVRRSYGRLRKRRLVRLAMWLATPMKPVFRSVRKLRGNQGNPRVGKSKRATSSGTHTEPSESHEAAVDVAADRPSATRFESAMLARLSAAPAVAVVIPVYNAPEQVERCLHSVLTNSSVNVDVIAIDDASTDSQIEPILRRFAQLGVTVLRNDANMGFVETVNRGFSATGNRDVVVLNSDTEVPPGWLARLRVAAYHDASVGTVTPLSNNAGAFSAPDSGSNVYPAADLDQISCAVARRSSRLYPAAPTGNGFCLYIKQAVLRDVGGFDAANFPRGYGEENDFCMRAGAHGWRHVIDDATVVLHELGSSFQGERDVLMAQGRETLRRLHPTYKAEVSKFLTSPALIEARRSVGLALQDVVTAREGRRPRALFVMHGARGGTPLTNRDLMNNIGHAYEPWLLKCDSKTLILQQQIDDELIDVESVSFDQPVEVAQSHAQYRQLVMQMLLDHDIQVIHIRQFIHHPTDLPEIARALDIPLVVSLHDYFTVCPTTQLLDESMRFCRGTCTSGQGECRIDFAWLQGLPHLKHSYVHEWRARFQEILLRADALVTTSGASRDVFVESFAALKDGDITVIEHGRDLQQSQLGRPPQPGKKIRILVPGNINEHKGGLAIKRLIELDVADRLEFFVLGESRPRLGEIGVQLGRYERDEFALRVEAVHPSFVAVLSIWGETYSHTLSEAWSVGVPVLAFDFGAVAERIRRWGGGWLLDHDHLEAAYAQILQIADHAQEYERQAERARVSNLRTTADMAQDYIALYDDVLAARRHSIVRA